MSGWDSGAHEELKIGRTLESARKERGLSLREAEEATKIRAAYLVELERENFDVLPAVYVQGFLKTYANFLQLDGEAMVRELKRRQGPREEPPLYVGPAEDDSLDDILTALGAARTKGRVEDEEDERRAMLPAGIASYLYLVSAVVLVLAVTVLALTVAGDQQPSAVSQVREPLISQAPQASQPDTGQSVDSQQPAQEEKDTAEAKEAPDRTDGDEEDEQASRTEQDRDSSGPEWNSASATASAAPEGSSASATARSSIAATEQDAEKKVPAIAEPSRRSFVPAPRASAPRAEAPLQPSARPAVQPGGAPSVGNGSPPPGDDGELKVRVDVGAEDSVRLSGGPFDD